MPHAFIRNGAIYLTRTNILIEKKLDLLRMIIYNFFDISLAKVVSIHSNTIENTPFF